MSQYISLTLDDGETFSLYQSDMTSAFYLFRLPLAWQRFLCFNICFKGEEIGKVRGKRYFLAAAVLPMGWGSAVAVMQEVSTKLLVEQGLDSERQAFSSQAKRLREVMRLQEGVNCMKRLNLLGRKVGSCHLIRSVCRALLLCKNWEPCWTGTHNIWV